MQKRPGGFLSISVLFSPLFPLTSVLISLPVNTSIAAPSASHVVISEVKIEGYTADFNPTDNFVELYNPTESLVSLSGWKLVYREDEQSTSDVTQDCILLEFPNGTVMRPYSYVLCACNGYSHTVQPDYTYDYLTGTGNSQSMAYMYKAGAFGIRDDKGVLVDSVGWYRSGTYYPDEELTEGGKENCAPAPYVSARQPHPSIERRPGATEEYSGNGVDTDNNRNDFQLREVADPQNSHSAVEYEVEPEQPGEVLDVEVTPRKFDSHKKLPLYIVYNGPKDARYSIRIFDLRGRVVRILAESITWGGVSPSQRTLEWLGDDAIDRTVSPGIYVLQVEADHANGGKSKLHESVAVVVRLK